MSTIDLSWLQPISWVAAAIGVCVAAFYYVINLRETTKNRRAALTSSLMQPFASREGGRIFIDLMNMEWTDFEDFVKRYDSHVNPENFAERIAFWTGFDILGYQYRTGLIDNETVYSTLRGQIVNVWLKFQPIIYEYKKRLEFPKDAYDNFEFMANELSRMYKERDPAYKGASSYFKPEEYDRAFGK
jgi:hypothetical protein